MNTNDIKGAIQQYRRDMRDRITDVPPRIDGEHARNGLAFDIFDSKRPVPPPVLPQIHLEKRGVFVNNDRPPPHPSAQQKPRHPLEPANTPREDKSDVVRKIEAMQAQREARRRRASAAKAQRAQAVKDAQDAGTDVAAVEFLGKLAAYRQVHGIGEPQRWVSGENVWDGGGDGSIRVCVRKRPMLKGERESQDFDVVDITKSGQEVVVHEPKTRVDLTKDVESHAFGFDACFSEVDSNETIHEAVLSPLLRHVLDGGTATVFAFGQTGSGKTCTLAGHGDRRRDDGNGTGLYALASHELMGAVTARGDEVRVAVSFYEIYRGHVLDLLAERRRLEVQEDGRGHVQLPGLASVPVASAEEMLATIHRAEQRRIVGCTSANETSSRSHAVLQVCLSGYATGKLLLVDLAGSERASDSTSKDRQTRAEGAEINKSLLALKECIRGLDGHGAGAHVPFRGSKLTHVLREAFIGRAKTCMIATVAPGAAAAEHTLNTLRYAQRVRSFAATEPMKKPPVAKPPVAKPPVAKPPAAEPPATKPPGIRSDCCDDPRPLADKYAPGMPTKRLAADRSPPGAPSKLPPRSAPAAASNAAHTRIPAPAAAPARAVKGRRMSEGVDYEAERAMYEALAIDANALASDDATTVQRKNVLLPHQARPMAAGQARQRSVFTATKACW